MAKHKYALNSLNVQNEMEVTKIHLSPEYKLLKCMITFSFKKLMQLYKRSHSSGKIHE